MPARPQRFKRFGRIESRHYDIVRVSESVFAVRGKNDSGIPTNSSIIVGDNGVAVVDSHQRPSLDREVIGIVRQITDRPIRYLINTHWHQDHTLGNQVFEEFAVIVGHETTKAELINRVAPNIELQRQVLPEQQRQAREELSMVTDAEQRRRLALQIELDEEYIEELSSIHVTPPGRVFKESYKLDISRQPIELLHFGLGHTHGDVIVHLPQEGTIILGDLLTAGQPFMRKNDAVPSKWGPTLRRIAKLPWDKAVIGHGWTDNPRDRLSVVADYLETLVAEVSRVADLPAAEVPAAVLPRLRPFAQHFPYFDQAVFDNIERTWEEIRSHG